MSTFSIYNFFYITRWFAMTSLSPRETVHRKEGTCSLSKIKESLLPMLLYKEFPMASVLTKLIQGPFCLHEHLCLSSSVQNCNHKKLQIPYGIKARSLIFRIKEVYLILIKRLQSLHSLLLIFWNTTGEKLIHIHDTALSPALKDKSLEITTSGRTLPTGK